VSIGTVDKAVLQRKNEIDAINNKMAKIMKLIMKVKIDIDKNQMTTYRLATLKRRHKLTNNIELKRKERQVEDMNHKNKMRQEEIMPEKTSLTYDEEDEDDDDEEMDFR
jgi:hypothetical protein